jgi:hypothetical protein
MRKRFTYANVAATLALIFSMSGGALAASHYLINSTKQINPKVLKKLTGKTGAAGLAGKQGPTGKEGPAGKEGAKGETGANLTAETTLPSGQSESGTFSAGGGYVYPHEYAAGFFDDGYIGSAITYVQPLATPIADEHIIDVTNGKSASHCEGVGKAEKGYLCLYDWDRNDVEEGFGYSNDAGDFSSPSPGVVLYWYVAGEGEPYSGGEYTVTAP